MTDGNTSIVQFMSEEAVAENIKNTLGKRTPQFIASVAALVNSNVQLQECDRKSLLSACLVAASLDLPINQNLGFAYIIPYKDEARGKVAQFQMGWKGFVQLAQRSGQVKTINATDVREGEIVEHNQLTGEMTFEWKIERNELPIIGYVAYIELLNGFTKTLYMGNEELKKHAGKYSQSFKYNSAMNLWRDDFDVMAKKTVIKLLLSKYAPMTSDIQTALLADQAYITEDGEYEYVDNQLPEPEKIKPNPEEVKEVMARIYEN